MAVKHKYFPSLSLPINLVYHEKKHFFRHLKKSCIGKVLALHASVACFIPDEAARIYAMYEALRGYCPSGRGCDQSIGFTVSDAMSLAGCGPL